MRRAKVACLAAVYAVCGVLPSTASANPQGRIYDPNPVRAEGATSDVALTDLSSATDLQGTFASVASCSFVLGSCTPQHRASADGNGNFLFTPSEPARDDAFAEVNAYVHATRAGRYFSDRFALRAECCGIAQPLEIMVNYAKSAADSFDGALFQWSSCDAAQCPRLLLGQGATRDWAYDGDVVVHEYAHAIFDERTGNQGYAIDMLGASYEPLAIKEGTSDYFAATLNGDPEIAEYLAGLGPWPNEGALRSLDNTLRCPDDLTGEGHQDGRIWGGLLWELRALLGAERADALVVESVLAVGATPSLQGATSALLDATNNAVAAGQVTAAELTELRGRAAQRGLTDCTRIVPLRADPATGATTPMGFSGYPGTTGVYGSLAPVHYRIDPPHSARTAAIELSALDTASVYHLLVRRGAPVAFDPVTSDVVADASIAVVQGRATLDLAALSASAACEPLYVAVVDETLASIGASSYRISVTYPGLSASATAAPCAAGHLRGGAFSCAFAPHGPAPHTAPLALVLGACVVARRRRRRSL